MIAKVSEAQSVNPVPSASPAPVQTPPVGAVGHQAVPPVQHDYRLVIEEDQASGAFVYKTLDRETGEVLRQIPDEEVLKLKRDPAYDPGTVVSTRA